MTTVDAATVALVTEALRIAPDATSLYLTVAEWAESPAWDTMLVVAVGTHGALDAFELDANTIATFAVTHPPNGACTIVVDIDLLAAVFHNAASS
ncbi:hypothetical protein [Rhodococcus sp. NPDC004095]